MSYPKNRILFHHPNWRKLESKYFTQILGVFQNFFTAFHTSFTKHNPKENSHGILRNIACYLSISRRPFLCIAARFN